MIRNQAWTAFFYIEQVDSVQNLLRALVTEYKLLNLPGLPSERIHKVFLTIDKRLTNHIDVHNAVMELCIEELFKKSFLHLQRSHIQSIALEIDLLLKSIRSRCLITSLLIPKRISEMEIVIRTLLQGIEKSLEIAAGNYILAMTLLTKRQIHICTNLYTYPVELRYFVLSFLGGVSKLFVFAKNPNSFQQQFKPGA